MPRYDAAMHPGRRILKLIRTAAVVLSTLLFLAAIGMWPRSLWRNDGASRLFKYERGSWRFSCQSARGSIYLDWVRNWWVDEIQFPLLVRSRTWTFWSKEAPPNGAVEIFLPDTTAGFAFRSRSNPFAPGYGQAEQEIAIPYWFIALLSLPIPLLALRRWRRDRQIAREGLCPVCGYDLRASPTRCPECGTACESSG